MSSKFYPNGAGGSLGDQLDTCMPLITSGNIWYVSSLIGTDAASPAGQNREKPLATFVQAHTNAVAGDIVVCLQGHVESPANMSITKQLFVVGEGTTAGKPGVQFIRNGTQSMFTFSTANIEFRNLYFPAQTVSAGQPKINVSATFSRFVGCYFEAGALDVGAQIGLVSTVDGIRVDNTTFVSTATSRAAQPLAAIVASATATNQMEINGVVVSAGTVGWSNFSAIDLSLSTSCTNFRCLGLSLLLGADMLMPATWSGYINNQLTTGGSRVSAP